jgi:hypothetical protein
MNQTLLENSSQRQNDHFILEYLFFLLILTITYFCIKRRKKLYTAFLNRMAISPLSAFRRFLGVLIFIMIGIMLAFKLITQLLP